MGGVVIPRPLHIEPEVNQPQAVAAWCPGSATLGGLLIDDVTNPALTAGQDDPLAEPLNNRMLGIELPLLGELPCQFERGIRTGLRGRHNLSSHTVESPQEIRGKIPLQHIAGKQGEHLHARGWL
jgi:hypothetical protein